MKVSPFLSAFAETLTEEARKWMKDWISAHHAEILTLPTEEGRAVLGGGSHIRYGLDLELSASPLLKQALLRLEHGSTGVPQTWVLTKLREHLLPILNEPESLQQ